MGGVPVLLALAVVGVDYGYQPAGDGRIDYIVQVSPEHWDQAREAGEITSVIDPSVRGRVNRIIIRIGDGELPRDAGSPAATPDEEARASISPAHSLSPMPPPSDAAANIRIAMADSDNDYVPAPDLLADVNHSAETLGARVMRPGPQSREEPGGFQFPSERAGEEGQQRRTEAEPAAERSASPDRGREQNRSTEARSGSDDPLARLSNGSSRGNRSQADTNSRAASDPEPWVQPPSTDPRSDRSPRPAEATRPGTQPRHSVPGRDEANWSENPSPGRGNSTPYSRNETNSTADPAAAAAENDRRPATPSRGFGAQPMSPVPNSNSDYVQPNRGYADTPASLQDDRLAGYDRYGRPVNAAGELIPNAADRQPPAEAPQGRGYNPPTYQESYPDRFAMAASSAEHDRRRADAARLASESADVPQYGRDREPRTATRSEPSSPSDEAQAASKKAEQEIAAELAAARAALQANDEAAKKPSVVSQPVFNFLLLVSLVANAYLILQMSRLLQRYRTMVANMRSASTSVG